MKLFHFNPKGYGTQYTLLASDKQEAIEKIKMFVDKSLYFSRFHEDDYIINEINSDEILITHKG